MNLFHFTSRHWLLDEVAGGLLLQTLPVVARHNPPLLSFFHLPSFWWDRQRNKLLESLKFALLGDLFYWKMLTFEDVISPWFYSRIDKTVKPFEVKIGKIKASSV